MMLLEPIPLKIGDKEYILSKFPATVGREIMMQYPTSAMPKLGDYQTNHSLMLKIMSYVGVVIDGRDEPQMLTTEALVNNHVKSAEVLVKLEWAMIQHNFEFFKDGRASGFLESIMARVNESAVKTLTSFLGQSSRKG